MSTLHNQLEATRAALAPLNVKVWSSQKMTADEEAEWYALRAEIEDLERAVAREFFRAARTPE